MADKKPHLLLLNSRETPIQWKYKNRMLPPQEEELEEKRDYTQMATRFEASLNRYREEKRSRETARTLQVPAHINYIEIRFQSQFDFSKFGRSYLLDFGLEAVKFTEFNQKIVFSIIDERKFNLFFGKITAFIEFGKGNRTVEYDLRIIFIEDFFLLSSLKIKQYNELKAIIRFSILEGLDNLTTVNLIEQALDVFLQDQTVDYTFDKANNQLEIVQANEELVEKIIDNFDIIYSVTSSLSTVIGPSSFAIPQRSYGFTISNAQEELPLIGIIDTGIDRQTPIISLIVGSIDKTDTDALIDNENHGTAVAALAALGKQPYKVSYRGQLKANAKLLSLKVMNTSPAALSDHTVIGIIREAKANYPAIKLFVLTITYENCKRENETINDYAFQLDKLSYELDILIFICTANNDKAANENNNYNIAYFEEERTNLCTPAESMNNLTVGSCADNLVSGIFNGIANLKEFPSLFTRRHHLDLSKYFSRNKINKHLKKPDVLQAGGDYESFSMFIGTGERATLEVLSSDSTESFYKTAGTSFSTPLAANLAARILGHYPNLKAQSVKALMINSSSEDLISTTDGRHKKIMERVIGYGVPAEDEVLYSTPNRLTFVLEDRIKQKELIAFPIRVPNYLRSVTKNIGLLKVTATLCFSFLPEKDNQLAYCPIFMAFSIFKNKSLTEIQSNYDKARLKRRWTQDGYSTAKPIMYSNVQKISFSISKNEIINEDGIFKVAIHCKINPQMKMNIATIRGQIAKEYEFSLAISIEEKQPDRKLTNKLYAEMVAINQAEALGSIELENDIELEN
ncbi:MAG: S8 family serine peptidase [Bacteroidota bacterium]